MNLFICIPQILVRFATGAMRNSFGDDGIPYTLFGGGISFGITAVIALCIVEARNFDDDLEDVETNKKTQYLKLITNSN